MLARFKRLILDSMPPAIRGRLRAWRVRRLIHTFTPREVEHVYGSGPLKVYLSDPLAQGWYDHPWGELPEVAALRSGKLRPGALVFDLGAHQGVVAMMLAREVGPSGRVVAVEAIAHNVRAIEKNRALNGMPQIETVYSAVSDRPGTLTFNEGLNGAIDDGTGSSGRQEVEAVTIDALAGRFGTPDVVFLDIEGAECLALSGAPKTLAANPDFFVEVHVGHGLEKLGGSVARVLSFFPPERFRLSARAEKDEAFRPLTEDDPLTRDRFFLLAQAI